MVKYPNAAVDQVGRVHRWVVLIGALTTLAMVSATLASAALGYRWGY